MKFFVDNIYNALLLGTLLLSGGALLFPVLQRRGQKVSLLQATQLFNQGKTLILDVRDPAEFAASHIRDSRNIPLKELKDRTSELDKYKSKAVIVVCQAGVSSAKATGLLKSAGFNEVYSLDGGLTEWRAQGLPTVK
ncbi:hypothetical protein BH11PSE11_BH11PSE11_28690 [soil metagenome]